MKCLWENVDLFESIVSEYCGSKYGVAVDSCSNAIFLSLKYIDQKYCIEVPKKTYISVPMQVIHAGYKIKFKDIRWSGSYKLNPSPVIDSAQKFSEGIYEPSTLQCLSFHGKKRLSIGRGGMILTDDKKARDWLRAARYDGRSSIYYNQINKTGVPSLGWHMYMTPEQAVRGIEQYYKTPKKNEDTGGDSSYSVDLSTLECFSEGISCEK